MIAITAGTIDPIRRSIGRPPTVNAMQPDVGPSDWQTLRYRCRDVRRLLRPRRYSDRHVNTRCPRENACQACLISAIPLSMLRIR